MCTDYWVRLTFVKINVDMVHRPNDYDSCNALVLPSAKRKTKNKGKIDANRPLLKKKRRKELEKVLERRDKLKRVRCSALRYKSFALELS